MVWSQVADAGASLASMREFYREEGLVFDEAGQGEALRALMAEPAAGSVFGLFDAGKMEANVASPSLGHLVLTWAFSLEFGGRFALLDELWLAPEARGRGEGRRALEFAAAWARERGAKALRLEVAHENGRARALYARAGLTAQARDLMTLRLA